MTLIETISIWQREATKIKPPSGTDRLPAIGGLSGPAFFPEGFGLSRRTDIERRKPTIMAVGHNFGCAAYREEIGPPKGPGREDDKATWRNLDELLAKAGSDPSECFRTNWFIGLLPGTKQTGRFLLQPDATYERECRLLLIEQIRVLRPTVILFLGLEVVTRAHHIIPALEPWRNARKWIHIDRSSIGHSLRDAHVPQAGLKTNVAALLQPSFRTVNEGRRMKNMVVPLPESEIVRTLLSAGAHLDA